MGWFNDAVTHAAENLADQGRWRSMRTLHGGGTSTTLVESGQPVVQFASNDYLGLATNPVVAQAAAEAAVSMGTGSGASRLIVGSRTLHDSLEAEIAAWKQTEAALVFPTGFSANLGVLTSVVAAGGRDNTVVFSDQLNHASIIDGVRLSGAEYQVFAHNDLDQLAALLDSSNKPHPVVVSDQVFSMDGDIVDLQRLRSLCAEKDALLILDVAHDVFETALGSVQAAGSKGSGNEVQCEELLVGTLSKAVGSLGGYVAGTPAAIEIVVNLARSFIFTTAPTPTDTAAALAAIQLIRSSEGSDRKAALRRNIDQVRVGHPSPIIPVMLGDEDRAMKVSAALLDQGILVPAIRPPTVPEGTCRLRVALSAEHTSSEIDKLLTALDLLRVEL